METLKTNFRLYSDGKSKMKSSVFDLISGDKETKQTKGLAYLFSIYPDFTIQFLSRFIAKETTKQNCSIKDITSLEITAEEFTREDDNKNSRRADIIIKAFYNDKLSFAVIIEAKSIKAGSISVTDLKAQINHYTHEGRITSINNVPKIGVVLTKYKYDIEDIVCMDWNDIINFINDYIAKKKDYTTLKDYSEFLININKDMVIYDAEVLSIPAGKSIGLINKFNIYECPNNDKFNYKKAMFVGFRNSGGGTMSKLYKVDDVVILKAYQLKKDLEDGKEILADIDLDSNVRDNIIGYISEVPNFDEEEKKFYVLSDNEIINLEDLFGKADEDNNLPRPPKNNSFTAYYTLSQVLKGGIL